MKEWKKLLKPYDSRDFNNQTPVTADILLFGFIKEDLNVLMIVRGDEPFKGQLAFPGGFMDVSSDESLDEAAKRELLEETGLKDLYIEQLYTFSKKGRDPREFVAKTPTRVISTAYYALIDYEKVSAVAGSDATEVRWVPVKEAKKMTLAFDHNDILEKAVERIQNKINYTNIGFEFVPEKFTIPELQSVIEKVWDRKLDRNNFRTKLLKLGVLVPTKEVKKQGVGKPAPVYKFNKKALQNLRHGETLFG